MNKEKKQNLVNSETRKYIENKIINKQTLYEFAEAVVDATLKAEPDKYKSGHEDGFNDGVRAAINVVENIPYISPKYED